MKYTTIQNVSFTSGEPFIRYDDLCGLVSYTCECGLNSQKMIRVGSDRKGYWKINN